MAFVKTEKLPSSRQEPLEWMFTVVARSWGKASPGTQKGPAYMVEAGLRVPRMPLVWSPLSCLHLYGHLCGFPLGTTWRYPRDGHLGDTSQNIPPWARHSSTKHNNNRAVSTNQITIWKLRNFMFWSPLPCLNLYFMFWKPCWAGRGRTRGKKCS